MGFCYGNHTARARYISTIIWCSAGTAQWFWQGLSTTSVSRRHRWRTHRRWNETTNILSLRSHGKFQYYSPKRGILLNDINMAFFLLDSFPCILHAIHALTENSFHIYNACLMLYSDVCFASESEKCIDCPLSTQNQKWTWMEKKVKQTAGRMTAVKKVHTNRLWCFTSCQTKKRLFSLVLRRTANKQMRKERQRESARQRRGEGSCWKEKTTCDRREQLQFNQRSHKITWCFGTHTLGTCSKYSLRHAFG